MEVVKTEETAMEVVKTEETAMETAPAIGVKRKLEEIQNEETAVKSEDQGDDTVKTEENGVGQVGDAKDEFEDDANDDEEDEPKIEIPEEIDPQVANAFKEKVKAAQQKQLDDYSKNVQDNVRLHEDGWKDRYYTDKCKADDVEANGGREHLFRSYVMGLCWVMKYYYDGCKLLVFGPAHFFCLATTHTLLLAIHL
jgi:5'-3' exoribonuclease 2